MTAPWREPAGSSRRDARRLEAEAVAAAETPLGDPFLRNELHRLDADGPDAGRGDANRTGASGTGMSGTGADAGDLPPEPQHDTIDLREQLGLSRTPDVPFVPGDADDLWRPGGAEEAALGDAELGHAELADAALEDGAVEDGAVEDAADEDAAVDAPVFDEPVVEPPVVDRTAVDDASNDDPGTGPSPDDLVEPSEVERQQTAIAVEAVHLLSQAQLIADRCVEDAEQYARDLVVVARTQYREILQRAEEVAAATLAGLPPTTGDPGVPYVPLPEIEYVRTYAQVARVQLRSVLDALTEQVDRLGNLPDLGVSRPDPVPMDLGDVSWDPDIDRAFR